MAVQTTSVRTTLAGNGSATVFPFPFHCTDPATISVVYTDPGGARVTLSPAAYSVTLNAPPADGGWVTYPLSGSPIPVGSSLTISRTVPLTQDVELTNQAGFYPSVINGALDRLAMVDQQLAEEQGRAIRLPTPETVAPLPDAATRRNKLLGFDSGGSPIAYVVPDGGVFRGDFSLSTVTPAGGEVALTIAEQLGYVANVRAFGAKGNGTDDDTAAIQAAINTGRRVYFPKGSYRITGTLIMNTAGQGLIGDGHSSDGSELLFDNGAANGIVVGSLGASVEAVLFRDLRLAGNGKTGGDLLQMWRVSRARLENVIVANPYNGIMLYGINDVSLTDVTCAGVIGSYALKISGDDTYRWNVVNLRRFGTSPDDTTRPNRPIGILVDGPGGTLQIHTASHVRMGRGLVVQNSTGFTGSCEFIESHAFEADFPEYEAIKLDVGASYYFTDTYAHGSTAGPGISIGASVANVQFHGGNVTGHWQSGIKIDGREVAIAGMAVARNSVSATGVYHGIEIGATAANLRLYGLMVGIRNKLSGLQGYGVSIASGADHITIAGCDLTGNATGPLNDPSGAAVVSGCNGVLPNFSYWGTNPVEIGNQGQTVLRVGNTVPLTVVNRIRVAAGAAGSPAQIMVEGEANAGLVIATLGAGVGRLRHDATDALTWNSARVEVLKPLRLPSFTVATLPDAAANARCEVYVSDGASSKRLAISDGTSWRFPDGTVVS